MTETKLQIGGSCHLVDMVYEFSQRQVSLRYIERSPDSYYGDTETSIDIDEPLAREIVAFLQAAFNLK